MKKRLFNVLGVVVAIVATMVASTATFLIVEQPETPDVLR